MRTYANTRSRAAALGYLELPRTMQSSSDHDELSATIAEYQDSDIAVAVTTARSNVRASTIVWVNAAFEELTGYSVAEAVGRSAVLLAGAHPDMIHVREIELMKAHPESASFGIVATKQRPDGSWYDVEERVRPLRGPGDEASHYVVCQRELVAGRGTSAAGVCGR